MALQVFKLANEFSLFPSMHPNIIKAGLPWKAIQHQFFKLVAEEKKYVKIQKVLDQSGNFLLNLVSFSSIFAQSIEPVDTYQKVIEVPDL